MADLNAVAGLGYGRSLLMVTPPALIANLADREVYHLGETVTRGLWLTRQVTDEALHVVANTVTFIIGNTGQVAFNASPSHASVTSYTARIRVSGSSTVTATQSLGVPTPDGNNVIVVDLSATFSGLAAGNYTVSILTTTAGGSADSAESSPFALPLS